LSITTKVSAKWKLVQAKVYKNQQSITGYAMIDDESQQEDLDTENDIVEATKAISLDESKEELEEKEVVEEEEEEVVEEEEEEEEEEVVEEESEEVEQEPVPPPKVTKPRAKRGVAA
jgi:outer membrane biosynthesis protein TonB